MLSSAQQFGWRFGLVVKKVVWQFGLVVEDKLKVYSNELSGNW